MERMTADEREQIIQSRIRANRCPMCNRKPAYDGATFCGAACCCMYESHYDPDVEEEDEPQ